MSRMAMAVLGAVSMVAGARADTVHLTNGNRIEGRATVEGDWVGIEIPGGTVSVPRQAVTSIEKSPTVFDEYDRRHAALAADDVAGRLELAAWCRQNGLRTRGDAILNEVLSIEPNNVEARELLGYVKENGSWTRPSKVVVTGGEQQPTDPPAQQPVQQPVQQPAQAAPEAGSDYGTVPNIGYIYGYVPNHFYYTHYTHYSWPYRYYRPRVFYNFGVPCVVVGHRRDLDGRKNFDRPRRDRGESHADGKPDRRRKAEPRHSPSVVRDAPVAARESPRTATRPSPAPAVRVPVRRVPELHGAPAVHQAPARQASRGQNQVQTHQGDRGGRGRSQDENGGRGERRR